MTENAVTYFWLVAVALADGRMANNTGKADLLPGATQEQLHDSIRGVLDSQYGTGQYVIVHYTVSPNRI